MKSKYAVIAAFLFLLLANLASAQYFTGTDLGNPGLAGSIVTNTDGSYTVSGSGGDIWGNSDQCYYYYAWASGTQWVATVQITDLQGPDNWTKGELMVRFSDPAVGPRANDGFIAAMTTRTGGQNEVGDQYRPNRGDGADWVELTPVWRPVYAAQWLRLSRTNSSFTVAFSMDGINYTNYLSIDTASTAPVGVSTFGHAWGDAVTVGLAVTAHNNAQLGTATFQNLSVTFPPVTPPTLIGAATQVQSTSQYAGSPATFSFVTTNNAQPPVVSFPTYVSYQWYRNGTAIANATSTSYTRLLSPSDPTENGSQYYCQATVLPPYNGSGVSLNSATGTLTVIPGAIYYTNGLKREFYAASRVAVENGNTAAPISLSGDGALDNAGGYGDNYTERRSGWFVPSATDYYVFFLACDDDTDLFLSTDGNPAHKRLIAQEMAWSPTRSWLTSGDNTVPSSQKRSDQWSPDGGATTPFVDGIPLSAGTPYYIEIIHHNGTGGDNFAVTYQTTNEVADPNWPTTFTNGVPGRMTNGLVLLTPPATTLTWSLQPTNTSISQGGSTAFFAQSQTDSQLVPVYQWYRNGTAIAGATRNSVGTGITTPANNGNTYFVVSKTAEGNLAITSSVVTLTVISAVLERGWASIEFWQGANRNTVETGAVGAPTYKTTSPAFEAAVNNETGSSYARRISGFFIAPATDDYDFFVNSDDDSDFFISTDATPSNKRLVCQETAYSNPLQWLGDVGNNTVNPNKRSDTWQGTNASPPYVNGIHLIGGQQYYIELVHGEGGGGDNCEATYRRRYTTAGTPDPDPWMYMDTRFRGNVLGTFIPRCSYVAFTQQPANATVAPSLSGTLSFTAVGASDSTTPVGITGDVRPLVGNWSYVMYQWQKNGVDIPGATSSTYRYFGPVLPTDNGAVFVCRMRALGYTDNSLTPIWSNSAPATLTVPAIPLVYEPGLVLVEHWNNKLRNDVETGVAGSLTWVSTSPEFAVSTNNESGTDYARRVAGYFIPPATDDYIFWINVDDDADLFLGTDSSPLTKRLIAHQESWSDQFQWNNLNNNNLNVTKHSDKYSDWATGLNNGFRAGIHLIGGQRYYLEGVYHEGGGGDNFEVTYSTVTGTQPNDGDDTLLKGNLVGTLAPASHVAITNQPQNTTTPSYSPVSFSVGVSSDSQISVGNAGDIRNSITTFVMYQWYKNGSAIAGGTASRYTLAMPLPSDNGAQFYCAVRSIGLGDGAGNAIWSNSVAATLNVVTNTPQFLYAAIYTNANFSPFTGVTNTFVTLAFDSPMDPDLLSQMTSYTLGGGLTILSVTVNSNDYRSVVLEVSGTPSFPFSITLNSGVRGLGGGRLVANTTLAVSKVLLTNQDIGIPGGDPSVAGQMVPEGPNAYMIACEGSDIWNNADGFNFSYEPKTNDFDVVVRQKDTRHTSNWSKGGLMIRESLDPGSRNWNIVNDPLSSDGIMAADGTGFGANVVEANARVATNGASGGWDFNRGPAPAFPNAWVRLTRRGDILSAYRSTDGQHWTLQATNNPTLVGDLAPLPSVVYIGICASAHHNDDPGTPPDQLKYLQVAHFAGYNSSYSPPPTLTATISGGNIIVSWLPTVGHLEATPAFGAGTDWQPVPGGTVSPVTLPLSGGARFFRVVNP